MLASHRLEQMLRCDTRSPRRPLPPSQGRKLGRMAGPTYATEVLTGAAVGHVGNSGDSL